MTDAAPRAKIPPRAIALVIFLLTSVTVCAVGISMGWIRPQTLRAAVAESGSAGMVVYVLGVVVLELLWIPRAWGLFAGGLLFGPWVGGLLSLVADMLGATLCYHLARSGGRDWVRTLLERRPKSARIVNTLAEKKGALTVAVLRVMPVAHYTVVSYAAGLTGVRPSSFLLGTAVGILPGAVLYPLVGDAALRPDRPVFLIGIAVFAVGFVVSAWLAKRYLRR